MEFSKLLVSNFIEANPQLGQSVPLLALSGGVDSMVLSDLLLKSGIEFCAAHCNFQLRDNDSDEDQKFIEEYCVRHGISLFVKRFNVEDFKAGGNYSTQMAARELRYDWFEQLMHEKGFGLLLTAHHLDDSFETFMINLLRGSGISGLTGISKQNGNIYRPLLSYSKSKIIEYAVENKISWREDRTNRETVYARNRIRHLIMPVLNEINPGFLNNFAKTISHLQSDRELIRSEIAKLKTLLFKTDGTDIRISIEKLNFPVSRESILFHLFSEFGFGHPSEIIKLIESDNNGMIESKTHRLIKNRSELILTTVKTVKNIDRVEINQDTIIQKPLYLKVLKSDKIDKNAVETLDYEKIKFPLYLRSPRQGDVFYPLGLKGSKKLSKFFKDEKYSMLDKERALVLTDSTDRIVWIIKKRMDDRFKVTKHTQLFLNIYLC